MPIKYYPNRIFKKIVPAIDRVLAKRSLVTVNGGGSIAITPISDVISCDTGWQVNSISFAFNSVTARDYGMQVLNGRKIVADYNDYLWFQTSNSAPQKITLDPGFYTGTQLATELQIQLNANAQFVALGRIFTVTYTNTTGLFLITPNAGTVAYINVCESQNLRSRDSIAGFLFGLNATTVLANHIDSDTAQIGLNSDFYLLNEQGSVVRTDYDDALHVLSMDQSIKIFTNKANVKVYYTLVYEEVV
jgi:hypothetical protein